MSKGLSPKLIVKPLDRLVFGLNGLIRKPVDIPRKNIHPDTKAMPTPVVNLDLPLLRLIWLVGLHNLGDDLRHVRHLDMVVLLRQRPRDRDSNLLDVLGDVQETGVADETGIEQRSLVTSAIISITTFGPILGHGEEVVCVRQQDGVLAAPAEASYAEAFAEALFLAEVLEEFLDDGEGGADAVVVPPGDEGVCSPEDVVPVVVGCQ